MYRYFKISSTVDEKTERTLGGITVATDPPGYQYIMYRNRVQEIATDIVSGRMKTGADIAEMIHREHEPVQGSGCIGANRCLPLQPHQILHGQGWPQLCQGAAAGEPGRCRCEDVPAMEGGTRFGTGGRGGSHGLDAIGLFYAPFCQEELKAAVIRSDEKVALSCCGEEATLAAHARVDHHQVDAAPGKVAVAVVEAAGSGSHIPGRDAVVQIDGEELGASAQELSLQLPHIGILPAEVGNQGKDAQGRGIHRAVRKAGESYTAPVAGVLSSAADGR